MLWTRFLRCEPCCPQPFVGPPQVDVLSKLFFDPGLHLFTIPDDVLLNILLKLSSKRLLLNWREKRGCASVVMTIILKTQQAFGVVALDQLASGDHCIFRDIQNVARGTAFGEKCEKLRPTPLHGTGAGAVDAPEVVWMMLELDG